MQKAVKVNPISANELNAEIEVYKTAIAELEALIEKDKSKKCEECYKETNRVLALVEQRESDAKHTIIKLTRELEALENRSCEGCKYHLSDNGNYPLHPCCECSRFFIDSWQSK